MSETGRGVAANASSSVVHARFIREAIAALKGKGDLRHMGAPRKIVEKEDGQLELEVKKVVEAKRKKQCRGKPGISGFLALRAPLRTSYGRRKTNTDAILS